MFFKYLTTLNIKVADKLEFVAQYNVLSIFVYVSVDFHEHQKMYV